MNNIPVCVSMASSTSLEKMHELSEGRSWIQLYNFQEDFVMELLQRAEQTGYKVAILLMYQFSLEELRIIKMVLLSRLKLVLNKYLILQHILFGL